MNRSFLSGTGCARIIVLALSMLVLQACTAIKLGYNTAPTVSYWWLDRYLDFDDAQALRLREDLGELQQWHRNTQLPAYAQLLQRAQTLVAMDQVDATQVCALVQDARKQLVDIAQHAEPGAAALARSLTPEQMEHLEAKYAKTNEEFRKEWLSISLAKAREKRYEKALERAERVYGRLDTAQRSVLRQEIETSSFDPKIQQAERLRRQQDTLQTLRSLAGGKATAAQTEQAMRGLFERYRESPEPEYKAYGRRQIEEGCKSFVVTHNTATAAQRETAVQRLKAYEHDIRELAAQQR